MNENAKPYGASYGVVALRDCRRIRLFGYSGNAALRPGWPLFRLDHSTDVVLAGIYPQIGGRGGVGALHIGYAPQDWLILRDGERTIRGDEQFVIYQTGRAPGSAVATPLASAPRQP